RAVDRTYQLKAEAAGSMWKLGRHLHDLHSKELWRARLDEDGRAKYKTFAVFCTSELKMTDANAHRLIAVARRYDEETVNQCGTAKLGLLLMLPEKAHDGIFEKVKNSDIGFREVQAEVRKAKEEARAQGLLKTRHLGRSPNPLTRGREMITLVQIEGTKRIPLF